VFDIGSKSMTTLFKGKRTVSPKLIKLLNLVHFLFDAKKSKMTDVALSIVAHLPVKLIFEGDNFLMKTKKKQRSYIGIGSTLLY
jgi:hypothetical protein